MRRCLLLVILLSVLISLAPSVAAQEVLYRARIGGYTEGAAFIPNGPFANYIAMLDGYEVLGFPAQGVGKAPARKLFDTFDLTVNQPFRGMAYIATEKLFVFVENGRTDRLFLSDHLGRSAGSRTIVYPADDPYRANRFEGIVHIPPNAAVYPDHLAALSFCNTTLGTCAQDEMRVLVMKRDGTVVKEFAPSDEILGNVYDFWGIGFQMPDKLLCSGGAPYVWKMDFNGNLVGDFVYTGNDVDADEGVVQLANGKVAVTNGFGMLRLFDRNLKPLPHLDRDYTIGMGLSSARTLAWNTDTNQFLVSENVTYGVWEVSPRLNSKSFLFDMNSVDVWGFYPPPEAQQLLPWRIYSMAYLQDQHQIALSYLHPKTAGMFDRVRLVRFDTAGTLVGYERFYDWDQPARDLSPSFLSYVPAGEYGSTEEYLLRHAGPEFTKLLFVRPSMPTEDGMIDFSASGFTVIGALEYFKPDQNAPGKLFVTGSGNRAVVTTLNGTLLSEFNYREKLRISGATDLAYITSGPYAGAMAALAGDNNEIVIFKLP